MASTARPSELNSHSCVSKLAEPLPIVSALNPAGSVMKMANMSSMSARPAAISVCRLPEMVVRAPSPSGTWAPPGRLPASVSSTQSGPQRAIGMCIRKIAATAA